MKKILLSLLSCCSFIANGQGLFDSTRVGLVGGGLNSYYDTILNIKAYHAFTDYGRDEFGSISMGNQGDVRRTLTFKPNFSIAPNLGIAGYFDNFQKSASLPYYNVKAPSGGIRLLTGYEKGQMFGLHFTVNPISRLNVFIDFQRINARGNYFNQENKSDQLLFSSSYYTKSGVYKINGGLQWNKAKNLEWGGIADTLDFQENLLSNRELVPIQLTQSASVARQLRLMLDQQLRIARFGTSELSLFYNIEATSQSHAFVSSDSIFTINAVFQEAPIRDSIKFSMVENFAGVKWTLNKDSATKTNNQEIFFGAKYFSNVYGNAYSREAQNNLGVEASYSGQHKRFFWGVGGEMLLTNEYAGGSGLSGYAGYILKKSGYLILSAITQNATPSLFAQRFISNNFIWENDFENISWNSVVIQFKRKKFSVKAGTDMLQNYVYFDQSARPDQTSENLNTFFLEGNGTLPLGGNFYLDNRVRYQYTNTESIVRIPNWVLREVLYFERDIFKRAARLQTGVEFNYFSNFTSEAYMPATSMMYLQDEIQIGNFPYFNFLFNFKIKEFTFFLRLENITQGLFKYNYYAAPYYPLPDFALRIGANWRFFN